jgi:predicted Zn-dependent peptidase
LANGVRIIVLERPDYGNRVAARVFYKVDIAAERPGTAGLTHMLEHHLFKGSHFLGTTDWDAEREVAARVETLARQVDDEKNRLKDCFRQRETFSELERPCTTPRLDSLTKAYDEAIVEHNSYTISQPDRTAYMAAGATGLTASTGRDWMKYHADLPANRLELFMWIERSRMDNPVFRQFDPEKQVVIEQIRRGFNRADARFNRTLRSMTYEAHPYGWAHWFSDLEHATREDHWEIYHKFFIPQNTTLVVVGDIEADEVFTLAQRYWGDWPPTRPSPRLRNVEPEPAGERRLTATAAAGPAVALNVGTPAIGHPDQPVLQVVAELLGGRSGLLMQTLGDEQQLATGASASVWTSKYPSHFSIYVSARRNDDLPDVEQALSSTLGRLARGELHQTEIDAAAARLGFALAESLEDPGNAAVTLGSYATIYDWRLVNELPRLWSAVTPEDVARVSALYFAPERRVVGVLQRGQGPARAAEPGFDPLIQARPDNWPVGGPVEEFAQPLEEILPAAVPRTESQLAPLVDTDRQWTAWGALVAPRAGDPLPVAENVWYVPPWMAVRRGILDDRTTTRPQTIAAIRYPDAAPFVPPAASDFELQAVRGMAVFFVPDDFLPLFRTSVLLDASPLDDPVGKEGLHRLAFDILMRSGTAQYPGDRYHSLLDSLGVSITGNMTDRGARIDLLAPAAKAEHALELLGALVSDANRDPASFERMGSRAAIAADRAGDDPQTTLERMFAQAVNGEGHPLATHPTRTSIEAITYADLAATLDGMLVGSRMTMAGSGATDAGSMQRWVEASFSALRPGTAVEREPLPRPQPARGTLVTDDRPSAQALLTLGYPVFEGFSEDHAAFELASYILCGAGQGSRLFQLLRTELGVTAAVRCGANPRLNGFTTWELSFAGRPSTFGTAVTAACGAMQTMAAEGLTEAEFERAKSAYLQGHIPSMYRTAHRTATRSAEHALYGRYEFVSAAYLNYYAGDAEQMEAIKQVTFDDVNRAVRKYVRPDEATIAVVGPLDAVAEAGQLRACGEQHDVLP